MKIFTIAPDGGKGSGVTGYFLVEIKSLFSIVLLHFQKRGREAYHSHAFNALSIWLWGHAIETLLSGEKLGWKCGGIKYTPRESFHRYEALTSSWCLTFRGPWNDYWQESRNGKLVTLTHGRVEVD